MTTYRVSGPKDVLEHKPGDQFDADLDPENERILLEAGLVEVVPPNTRGAKASAQPDATGEEVTRSG